MYNDIGERYKTGLDVDGDGALADASTDRIQYTETVFAYDGGWWQKSDTYTFLEDNNAAPRLVSTTRSRLSGFASGEIFETESTDAHGNVTVSTVSVTPSTKTRTTTVSHPDSDTDEETVNVSGLDVLVTASVYYQVKPLLNFRRLVSFPTSGGFQ